MKRERSRDRIRISEENAPVLESLGDQKRSGVVFEDQARAVVFAATIGFCFDRCEPIAGQANKAILFHQIDRATQLYEFVDLVLSVARTKDVVVLAAEDGDHGYDGPDAALMFEGYVNGGLTYIRIQDGFDLEAPLKTILSLVRTLDLDPFEFLGRE